MQKLEKFGTKCKTLCIIAVLSLFTLGSFAQSIVKGIVKDETGEGVMGATVKVEGTNDGAVTDMNGNFSVNPGPKGSLLVSYVGYVTQRVNVKGKSNVVVTLQTDEQSLNELVVVGYGVQKKSDLTGSVASVKEADLQNRSTTDAAAALQGKVSGVQILNSSGAPGQGAQIRVRGYSSNAGNLQPLLIVDGLKVDNIQYLDPSMIESMEVLKDAASAAIYGAEAGNGVILITTKSGKKGTSSITYDVKFINQSLGKKAELMNAQEYINYNKYIGTLDDTSIANKGWDGKDHNWLDATFEDSWAVQHSLTFQGGNDKGHFLAGLNYVKNDGIVVGDRDVYKRFTAQINADYQIKKWLKVGTNNSIEKWETKSVSDRGYGSALNSSMSLDPLTPAYYNTIDECAQAMKNAYATGLNVPVTPDGKYYGTSAFVEESTGNPIFQINKTDGTSGGWTLRGSSFLDFNPIDGLVFTSRIGYRVYHSTNHSYSEPYYLTPMAQATTYSLSGGANTGWYYQWENFVNYNKTFAEKHNLNVMAGMSWTEDNTDNFSISASQGDLLQGYSPNYHYIEYYLPAIDPDTHNAPGLSRNLSYYGRLSYSYDNRYFFQANFRADAYDSSKLHKDKRWGYFPSFSAGWTISNEKFFKDNVDTDAFSFLKLRASWGRNGNVNVLNNYQYNNSVNLNSQWYQYTVGDPTQTYGTAPEDKLPNPDLTWETSEQVDLGLEARFLSNRLTFGVDWYNKITNDLLLKYTPVPEAGYKNSYMNAGKVQNTGFEFELGWKDNINDFVYSVNANLSTLKNEVKELNVLVPRIYGTGGGVSGLNFKVQTICEEGHPLWYFRGVDFAGVNPETGEAIYRNAAGEEVSSVQDGDLKEIGSAIPDITYGITINLAYKGFDFTLYGAGAAGCDIFSLLYSADRPTTNTLKTYYENSWKQAGDHAKYPNLANVKTNWYFWSSNASMFSGNYFKFKQIQLGYTLPKAISRKIFIENLRAYVSLDDFFTITNYPGCDPETALGYGSAGLQDSGYDSGVYPTSKKIVFGLNVTF